MAAFTIDDVTVEPGQRGFTWRHVADLLMGAPLRLPLHVLHGAEPGPTLAVNAVVHGNEHFPLQILWEFIPSLDLSQLRGTILVISVCNPIAFADNTRIVIEDDIDFGNVNRVFPGKRAAAVFGAGASDPSDRTLAERIADTVVTTLLDRADFALDLHCHQEAIGLVKGIIGSKLSGKAAEWAPKMCKAWGLGTIHKYSTSGNTFSGQADLRGIPCCVAEIGTGASASAALERELARRGAEGFRNMLRVLGMLPGEVMSYGPQLIYGHGPHVRPTSGGYLISELDPTSLFENGRCGVKVEAGQLLGRVFNPYTMELIEELRSPCAGILYMARRNGPVEASGHAYAVADTADGTWEA